MLPKLEVHYGDEILHVPQSKKVNLLRLRTRKRLFVIHECAFTNGLVMLKRNTKARSSKSR